MANLGIGRKAVENNNMKSLIKVINSLEPEQFDRVCQVGEALVHAISEKLDEERIGATHTGSVLMVAMAGVLMETDMTFEDFFEGIQKCKKMWIEVDGGYALREIQREPKMAGTEN